MSFQRKRRRRENQILREQAMIWRQADYNEQEYPIRRRKQKFDFEYEETQSKIDDSKLKSSENISNNNIWDEDGKLIVEKKKYPTVVENRKQSPAKADDKNSKSKEKERFVTYITKKEDYHDQQSPVEPPKKLTQNEVNEMTLRLSQVKKVKRQKSVQPKKQSTDFAQFRNRQNACAQARNQQYEPETYKIEISEGSKKYINSEKNKNHTLKNIITKPQNDQYDDYQPTIQKKRSHHLQKLDCTQDLARKEAKRMQLANQIEEEQYQAFMKTKPRSASVKREPVKTNKNDTNALKARPDSIYNERMKIEHRINELNPIIEADNIYPEKEKKRKKHTLPDYLKPIYETFKPIYDEKRKQRANNS